MPRSLPARPDLELLRKQAKDILKAHRAGDPSCCEILRALRPFKDKSGADILSAKVSLQEVQFALAMEYGFKSWKHLKEQVEAQNREVKAVQTNKDVFRRYNEAANNHDAETMRSLVTGDCVIHYDEKVVTHEDMLQQQIKWWQECPPYRQYEIVEMIAEGDRVAVRMIAYGKETDGKVSRKNFSFGVRFEKGRIAESWHDMRIGYEREADQHAQPSANDPERKGDKTVRQSKGGWQIDCSRVAAPANGVVGMTSAIRKLSDRILDEAVKSGADSIRMSVSSGDSIAVEFHVGEEWRSVDSPPRRLIDSLLTRLLLAQEYGQGGIPLVLERTARVASLTINDITLTISLPEV